MRAAATVSATTEGSSLTRVPGPHDRVRKIAAIVFIATVLLGAAAVTLFDSTGLAIQDLAIARAAYDAWQAGSVPAQEITL